jgi:hypothetical protein
MKTSIIVYELNDGLRPILYGSLEDLRIFTKNLYTTSKYFIEMTLSIRLEEDYYAYLDNDANLLDALNKFSYRIKELCAVPIEDFQ